MQPVYRIIYLLCPANVQTGGPEALHQLGRALLDCGLDARMVYVAAAPDPEVANGLLTFPVIAEPMPPEYAHYNVPRDFQIVDSPDNAIVFPEIWPKIIPLISKAVPHMWWLSIDNGMRAVEAFGGIAAIAATRTLHLCQSYYALAYLAERGLPGLPLFDYTSPEHAAAAARSLDAPRQDRILYPSRGKWFTGWLRRWAPNLPWQEISGFTPAQVQELFLTSKLYVDFGSHPGKDRMPREAAILGCCVIVGLRGAAGNPFDVPIPAAYKFRDSRLRIPRIVAHIRAVLANFESCTADFATYRRIIMGEQIEFLAQAARIFGGRMIAAPALPQSHSAIAPRGRAPDQ